jgi:hypothetical protein
MIHDQDCHKTTVRIKSRLYEWTRIPMEYKKFSVIFQRTMNNRIYRCIMLCYVDDILILGKTKEEHDKAFRAIVKILIIHNITTNKNKMSYAVAEIKFLGKIKSFRA